MKFMSFLAAFVVVFFHISVNAESSSVVKIPLTFPDKIKSTSFVLALGSGLASAEAEKKSDAEYFYALTDGGPGEAPEGCSEEVRKDVETFRPHYARFKLENGKAYVEWTRPILSGSPIDPEGIATGEGGTLWIAEEEEPSLLQIEVESGRVLRKLSPGDGLPEILKERASGKGFEGLTMTRSGNLVAVLQAPLDIKGKTLEKSKLIRIVQVEPETTAVTMYGYDISGARYEGAQEVKLSAIEALSEKIFYVLERIIKKDEVFFTLQLVQIADATPLKKKKKKKEYEFKKTPFSAELLPVQSQTIFTFSDFEKSAKPEGLALSRDGSRLYVLEDNDFGKREAPGCFDLNAQTILSIYKLPILHVNQNAFGKTQPISLSNLKAF